MNPSQGLRISVVTPSLNQARFLREALDSTQTQSHPCHEHLVFDGGSDDGTVDLLQGIRASGTHPRLTWSSGSDTGQSSALNRGFAQATGDVIGWLNADDRYRPGCFAHVARAFVEDPTLDVLYGDYTLIDETGQHLALRREIEFSRFILRYHRVLYIPTTATFFRRRIFDEGHRLREDLHYAMDVDLFLRLADAGYRFRHLPAVLADFREHNQSKSARFTRVHREEHRSLILSETPLARRFRSPRLRKVAATCLQISAGLLRYTEKLLRGLYLPERTSVSPAIVRLGHGGRL